MQPRLPARPAAPSGGTDWRALLRPKGLRDSAPGTLLAAVATLALALVLVVESALPSGSSIGSLAVLPVLAGAWLLQRPLLALVAATAVATRLVVVATGRPGSPPASPRSSPWSRWR
jgi:hypothetical protein